MPHIRTCGRLQGMKCSGIRLHRDTLDSAEQLKDGLTPTHARCFYLSVLSHLPLFASSTCLM